MSFKSSRLASPAVIGPTGRVSCHSASARGCGEQSRRRRFGAQRVEDDGCDIRRFLEVVANEPFFDPSLEAVLEFNRIEVVVHLSAESRADYDLGHSEGRSFDGEALAKPAQ